MELFRVHAYSVSPQRGTESSTKPEGGAVTISAELRHVIDENLQSSELEKRTAVDFRVDPTTRTNSTRDCILQYAFEEPSAAKAAALSLANRLAAAMDRRSTPCLFVPAALRDAN